MSVYVTPITGLMAGKKFPRLLTGFLNRSQRTGGGNHNRASESFTAVSMDHHYEDC
jgi:hypothetical protein